MSLETEKLIVLPADTIVKLDNIPIRIVGNTMVSVTEENWKSLQELQAANILQLKRGSK